MDWFEGKVQFEWQVAGLLVKKDDIAGALFAEQEGSTELLKALPENEGLADAVQKIISTETWKAARLKHAETAA